MEPILREEKEKPEIEKINLNEFFNLIINSTETNKYLQNFNNNMSEFYSLNINHYNKINKLLGKINSEKCGQNYINTSLFILQSVIENIITIQLKSLEIFISKKEQFLSIENQIVNLQKKIENFSSKFKNNNLNINIYKDANSLLENLVNRIRELEIKVTDEYIKEKYNKNVFNTNDEKTEQIVSDIKYLEKTYYDYIQERKNQYFKNLKKSNNQIQTAFEELKKNFEEYYNGLKEINKIFVDDLKNLENILKSNVKNEQLEEYQNFVFSQSDIDLVSNIKYKIKILKNPKISLKNSKANEINGSNWHKTINNSKEAKIYRESVLYLTEKDLYEIISRLYSYNLKVFDKSIYNLDLEKEKLMAMDLSKEILLYNEPDENVQKKLEEKYNEIIESINNKILNRIENMETFFICLNNYRTSGKIQFNEKFYDLIIYIYNKVQEELLKNSNKKLESLMLILSQTYYKIINEKKIYLLEAIKKHELYNRMEFWKSFIINKIEEEFKIKRNFESKKDTIIHLTDQKKEDIVITKLFPFSELLKEYDISKDKIIDLVNQIFEKYKCSENQKEKIFAFINENN